MNQSKTPMTDAALKRDLDDLGQLHYPGAHLVSESKELETALTAHREALKEVEIEMERVSKELMAIHNATSGNHLTPTGLFGLNTRAMNLIVDIDKVIARIQSILKTQQPEQTT
jgi:hypothetical protein